MNNMPALQKILICSDLDRTIIPNGYQEESAHARAVFRQLAGHSNISLAYVSGRDKKLILEAIEEFELPVLEYVIGDVGTTLYQIINGNWHLSQDWSREMSQDWKGLDWEQQAGIVADIKDIWSSDSISHQSNVIHLADMLASQLQSLIRD